MWATNISLVLRPYLAPLYRLLNSPPGANYSIAPRMWPLFLHCLDSRAVFVREAMGLSLPLNSRVIESGNRPVHCKADLPLMAKPTGHTWIRISDPTCPVIKMTRAAQSSLAWLAPRIAAVPTTALSLPPMLSSLARADAMAEGDQVGIGGWVSTKHGLAWFAESYTMEEIRSFWPFLTKDAQKYIACFETLAQLALAMTAKAHLGHTRLSLCLPSQSDNTPTEGGVNKLFTTSLASLRVSEPDSLLELRPRSYIAGNPTWREPITNGPTTSAEADYKPSPTEPEIAYESHWKCWLQPQLKPLGPLRTLHKSHHFQTSLACQPAWNKMPRPTRFSAAHSLASQPH